MSTLRHQENADESNFRKMNSESLSEQISTLANAAGNYVNPVSYGDVVFQVRDGNVYRILVTHSILVENIVKQNAQVRETPNQKC